VVNSHRPASQVAAAPTLVWFRQDLRLQDNPALHAAVARGGPIIPVYIFEETAEGRWSMGAASRWWLHHSLLALDGALHERDLRLIVKRGDAAALVRELVASTGAVAVYWNRCYEPAAVARDAAIKADLTSGAIDVKSFNGALLNEPHTIANKQGRPFQVFTPYWRHCLSIPVAAPMKLQPGALPPPAQWPASLRIDELKLLPTIPWDAGFSRIWEPGEAAATKRLTQFVASTIDDYDVARDLPDRDGTSRLSPSLHFGEISPRQVWAAVKARSKSTGVFPPSNGARVYLAEIGWREFAYHLLFHFPRTPESPLREEFNRFPWAADPGGEKLRAWQRGRTGYPIVDAGLRQLWEMGWMHNRVRMIVGSFLVKHLRLSWTHGSTWFWDTLVDADLASNTLGWQWTAGSGADASPYFRIFAPVLQGRKFDADGQYVRRWVPELGKVPTAHIHAPWEAPAEVLASAGVRLGENYPRPIVDHATARAEALAAFKQLRSMRPGLEKPAG
jgi:deoxyribodipyrimidine photo-lyase